MHLPARLFVTGTDTGVGKTLVTAGLLRALAARGVRAAGMKPVATGAQPQDGVFVNQDVELLRACATMPLARELVCPCLYAAPTAPHLAAAAAGEQIDPARIAAAYATVCECAAAVLVEGIGGWALPLTADAMLAEIPKRLDLSVLLVVGVRLGALNHALLSARAILADGLPLAGWIANVIAPDYGWAQDTIETLTEYLPAPLLARIPWQEHATPQTVAPLLAAVATAMTGT